MKLQNLMMIIMQTAALNPFQIPHRYCIVKNCHVCVELIGDVNQLELRDESELVCFTLLQQKRCCEHYLRRSKGYQF